MIKINDILDAETNSVNASLKTHYFKDITTYGVAEIISKEDEEGTEIKFPAIYKGRGNYQSIQDDTKGLIIYHRIIGEVPNEPDLEQGFGRNYEFVETYSIKSVFYGQQVAIEDDNCEDINFYLAQEFKKLVPTKITLSSRIFIRVIGMEFNKDKIQEDEGLKIVPESVLFTLSLDVVIKSMENCNTLTC